MARKTASSAASANVDTVPLSDSQAEVLFEAFQTEMSPGRSGASAKESPDDRDDHALKRSLHRAFSVEALKTFTEGSGFAPLTVILARSMLHN